MIAKYLFDKNPQLEYAKSLPNDKKAVKFLREHHNKALLKNEANRVNKSFEINKVQTNSINNSLSRNIFKSPQEEELFLAAKRMLPNYILLPNTALSTIIDVSVCSLLDKDKSSFFWKSTLDLCIVNPISFIPELFIELDSSWHDLPKNQNNDKKKNFIFSQAGLELFRLRKVENRSMIEEFELFIKQNLPNK
jgi:hypothetical protein